MIQFSSNHAPKIQRKKLEELVESVFPLNVPSSKIIKIIAISTSPPNLKEITSSFRNSDITKVGKTRWSVSRRINGSKEIQGLIPLDIINSIHEENTYHDMYRYYLTIKGIFASLYEIDFNSINSINWYFDYVKNIFKDKKLLQFAKDFIYYQIIFFLYLHKIKGFQLTNLVDTASYCMLFFNSSPQKLFEELPIESISKSELGEFKKISITYFAFQKIFKSLKKSNIFPKMNILDQYIPLETNALLFQPKMVNYSSHVLIQNWCNLLPSLQIMYYKTKDWNQKKVDWSLNNQENDTTRFQKDVNSKSTHQAKNILEFY